MDESTDIQEPIVSDDAERVLVAPEDRAAIRILVVDDEPSILESCETVLGGEGYGCQVVRREVGAWIGHAGRKQLRSSSVFCALTKRTPKTGSVSTTGSTALAGTGFSRRLASRSPSTTSIPWPIIRRQGWLNSLSETVLILHCSRPLEDYATSPSD